MKIESTVVRELIISRNKAGGSAAENVDIELPRGTRTIQFCVVCEGAGNAITNQLGCRGDYADGTIDVNRGVNFLYNSGALGAFCNTTTTNVCGNVVRWTVQANAATANEFLLHVKFLSI